MSDMTEAKIVILATDGYERSELRVPHEALKNRGADVRIASIKAGEIRSWDRKDWGDSIAVDLPASAVKAADFDALVLPGGQINPDLLRVDAEAMRVVREFIAAGKVVAAICHAPWLLVEADALHGRAATSYPSIRKDLENAGAKWRDEAVVVDGSFITSRRPDDLDAFVDRIAEEVAKVLQAR